MTIFALVDCNNFYASCERVFNPNLEGKPIVVLSNNDGCIIARSNEAKKLGIPMGSPFYSQRDFCRDHGVHVLSSNYQLYGDMSHRVMESLRRFVPEMEVYSIDEAFLCFDGFTCDLLAYSRQIRTSVKMWTGIPVSIGIAPTKTLSKVANHIAKKSAPTGVFSLLEKAAQEEALNQLDVEQIWGISSRWGAKLKQCGIHTAQQLRDSNEKMIRKQLSVLGERIVLELRGVSSMPLEMQPPARKNIMSSKSFGSAVSELAAIEEAIANYAARACTKLRKQHSRTQGVHVFLKTNHFRRDEPQYHPGVTLGFTVPTSDTRLIIKTAIRCLRRIYRPGFRYRKTGIILLDLLPDNLEQKDLFEKAHQPRSDCLMRTLDSINDRMGKDTIFLASQGIRRPWQMRCDKRSPHYTTNWNDLARALCN